jgi:anaerobic selenocysteine-containing dehydrogenase
MRGRLTALLVALALAAPAGAQNFAPAPPAPAPAPGTPVATICSAEPGWCPLRAVVAPGGPCYCFVPPSTWIPGVARYFPYEGPVSPYLNPHTGPPARLR